MSKIWNALDQSQRKLLLFAAYPQRTEQFAEYESWQKWNKLLLSTRKELGRVNWNIVLAKKVLSIAD